MSSNLNHLPLKWLHRGRNRLYLGENKIDMKVRRVPEVPKYQRHSVVLGFLRMGGMD